MLILVVLGACGPVADPAVGVAYRYAGLDTLLPRIAAELGESLPRLVFDSTRRGLALEQEIYLATEFSRNPDIVAVIGHRDSRSMLLAAPVYAEAGLPVVVPTANSTRLTSSDAPLFRLTPSLDREGEFLASFVLEGLGSRTATIFFVGDEYGIGLRRAVTSRLRAGGVTILDEVPYAVGQCPSGTAGTDLRTQVAASLVHGHPEVVILAGRQRESACVIALLHEMSPGSRFVGGDGIIVTESMVELAGPAMDSLYVVVNWHPGVSNSRSRAFAAAVERITGAPPQPYLALVYESARLLHTALRDGGRTRGAVASWLGTLGRGRPPYAGLTGPITFDDGQAAGRLYLMRSSGGRLRPMAWP